MSWNGPNGGSDKDPWSGRRKQQSGPPDLDEAFRKLQQKFARLFSNRSGGPRGPGSDDHNTSGGGGAVAGFIFGIIVLLVLWGLAGIFIVAPAERAPVLRFGKYINTQGPGIHWIPRFIDTRYLVNVQEVTAFPYQSEMLTKDENIVDVSIVVQYRVDNAKDFLFNVVNPRVSLQEATASALRQVIGSDTLDQILTVGREQVRNSVFEKLRAILDIYDSGIEVMDVTMQPAKPPEAVTAAFDDAIKAREDEQRYINQARAYQNRVVPVAQGQAQRILQDAKAYKQEVLFAAKGHVARFNALLQAYQQAPIVTKDRLYLDAMQEVFANSSKVLVDTKSSNNLLYLPLDKLLKTAPAQTSEVIKVEEPAMQHTRVPSSRASNDPARPSRVGRFSQQVDNGARRGGYSG